MRPGADLTTTKKWIAEALWWVAEKARPLDVEVWVELIPFDETRFFVRRVMLSWEEYRRLYSSPPGTRP